MNEQAIVVVGGHGGVETQSSHWWQQSHLRIGSKKGRAAGLRWQKIGPIDSGSRRHSGFALMPLLNSGLTPRSSGRAESRLVPGEHQQRVVQPAFVTPLNANVRRHTSKTLARSTQRWQVDDLLYLSRSMKFAELPQSIHPSVSLRVIEAADLEAWYSYLSVPSVIEHTSWNLKSSAELAGYVGGAEPVTDSSRLRLAIALRESNALVGTIGFHTVSSENKSAEIAYDLSPSIWHQGIATYACRLLVVWAHEHVGLVRIQATVLESNLPSQAVLARCGFEREGLLRSYRVVRGRSGNFFMYSNVVQSWPAA